MICLAVELKAFDPPLPIIPQISRSGKSRFALARLVAFVGTGANTQVRCPVRSYRRPNVIAIGLKRALAPGLLRPALVFWFKSIAKGGGAISQGIEATRVF